MWQLFGLLLLASAGPVALDVARQRHASFWGFTLK